MGRNMAMRGAGSSARVLGAAARQIGRCNIGAGTAAGTQPCFELQRFQRVGTAGYTLTHLRLGNGVADTDEHIETYKKKDPWRYINACLLT